MTTSSARIVVVGTSGAGKSTFARRLAARLDVPHIELDAINWQPGWRDLTTHDPAEFVRRVGEAIARDSWVVDGNYGPVREIVWLRATHLVWLDYSKWVVMARVLWRSFSRALLRTRLWGDNREDWRRMFRPSHPIRWAWSTWSRRRREISQRLAEPAHAHLKVVHLTHPGEADNAIEEVAAAARR